MTMADVFPLEEYGFYYEVARPASAANRGVERRSPGERRRRGGREDVPLHDRQARSRWRDRRARRPRANVPGSHAFVVTSEAEVDEATGLLIRRRPSRTACGARWPSSIGTARQPLVLVDFGAMTRDDRQLGEPATTSIVRSLRGPVAPSSRARSMSPGGSARCNSGYCSVRFGATARRYASPSSSANRSSTFRSRRPRAR